MTTAGLAEVLRHVVEATERYRNGAALKWSVPTAIGFALSEANAAWAETRRLWRAPDLHPCICPVCEPCPNLANYNDCLACTSCQAGCKEE